MVEFDPIHRRLVLIACVLSLLMWPRSASATFRIDWWNQADSGFDANEVRVMRAGIQRWESLIADLDGDPETEDVFRLQITKNPDLGWPAAAVRFGEQDGLPSSGAIEFDDGQDMPEPFRALYVEEDLLSNDEFEATSLPHYLVAKADSPAGALGSIDVLNAVLHEIGHVIGFASAYSRWQSAVEDDLTIDYGSGRVSLRGYHNWTGPTPDTSHLSCNSADLHATSLDLMCSSLTIPSRATRDRRFVSKLDLQILESVYGYTVNFDELITGPSGDFDDDGILDVADLNSLSVNVRSATHSSVFDLNYDERVDAADRKVWIKNIKQTWFGDANLDGAFDSGDLVHLFQVGEYEDAVPRNSTWSDGDFDGDGDFSNGDLVWAFQDGGYQLDSPTLIPVPEPSSFLLLGLLVLGNGLRKRNRWRD